MALKTFVKVSNVSNLSDARYCAGMMVDLLGFNIDPLSENKVTPDDYSEIIEWVSGVSFVGEFENSSKDNICQALNEYSIDYIQISDYAAVEEIGLLGKPMIFQIAIDSQADLSRLKSKLSYLDELVKMIVIRSTKSELYEEIDSQIGYYNANLKLLKGYGVSSDKELSKFPGLELEATKEEKPGFKDYGEIMDVLESIEED